MLIHLLNYHIFSLLGFEQSEAAAFEQLLVEQGVNPVDIKLEEYARSTVENALKCTGSYYLNILYV